MALERHIKFRKKIMMIEIMFDEILRGACIYLVRTKLEISFLKS